MGTEQIVHNKKTSILLRQKQNYQKDFMQRMR